MLARNPWSFPGGRHYLAYNWDEKKLVLYMVLMIYSFIASSGTVVLAPDQVNGSNFLVVGLVTLAVFSGSAVFVAYIAKVTVPIGFSSLEKLVYSFVLVVPVALALVLPIVSWKYS